MMRYRTITFLLLFFTLLPLGNSFGDELPEGYTEVVDLVYEWSPQGNAIQVGDYMISDLGSVWSDTGDGNVVMVGKSAINQGGLVKALLIDKDENGFWLADRIIVFSGKGVDSAMKGLAETKKEQLVSTQESSVETKDTLPDRPSEEPFLEDGVWKN